MQRAVGLHVPHLHIAVPGGEAPQHEHLVIHLLAAIPLDCRWRP
jgi:hypothetical protein